MADEHLLERIAQSLRTARASVTPGEVRAAAPTGEHDSILSRAAELYGARPTSDDTPPTGFDPAAAALFEALVEGAFLVAHADGEFDAEERAAFEQVVLAATKGRVAGEQLTALLADLEQQLGEDGAEVRLAFLAKSVAKPEHQREVVRVAALMGQISGGVSDVERGVLVRIAQGFGLGEAAVSDAMTAAEAVLG